MLRGQQSCGNKSPQGSIKCQCSDTRAGRDINDPDLDDALFSRENVRVSVAPGRKQDVDESLSWAGCINRPSKIYCNKSSVPQYFIRSSQPYISLSDPYRPNKLLIDKVYRIFIMAVT